LRRNCFTKYVIEGKIEETIKVRGRRRKRRRRRRIRRRRNQLLDDLK